MKRLFYMYSMALLAAFAAGCGKKDAADESKSPSLEGADFDTLMSRGANAVTRNDASAATDAAAKAVELNPESAEAKLLEGQAACLGKDYARAREAFSLIIAEGALPSALRSKAFAGRGTVEFEQDDAELARISFLQALLLDPNNAAAHYYLARIYRAEHFYEAARNEFKRFSEITRNSKPDDARANRVDSKDLPELESLIEAKLAKRFGSGGGNAGEAAKLIQEAKDLEGKKQFSEAAKKYAAARKADPRSYEAVSGYARRLVKDTKQKIMAYCDAIALNPDARDNYFEAAVLASSGGFKIQTVEILNHAIAHHPQDKNVLDLLCGALYKTGNNKMHTAWGEYRQEVIQRKGFPKKASPPKVSPQKEVPQSPSPPKASTPKASTPKASPQKAPPQKVSPPKAPEQKVSPQKAPVQRVTPQKAPAQRQFKRGKKVTTR